MALVSVAALTLAACSSTSTGGAANPTENPGQPVSGGSVTVLEDAAFAGGFPAGLDPSTNVTGGANLSMNQAIFGGLFLIGANDDGSDAKIVPNQAESYELSPDAKTMTIKLKPGIKFSDGTPFDAKAVKWNFERDLKATCSCAPRWALEKTDPITTPDDLTVVVKFSQPNAAQVASFPASNVNWIVSPTAAQKTPPEQFRLAPVGAGPFVVVSNKLSSVLELKKNPNYFEQGKPYLDKLTFKSIGGDQPAYQAMLAGQAQAYEGMNNIALIEQAQKSGKFNVAIQPATSPYVIQLNTKIPPFDNIKAREAIYYATDFDAIAKGVFKGKYEVSQGFTAPGGKYYEPKVEGYRTYDLAKAKQLVSELGGLEVNLGTISAVTATMINTALQTQWQQAGIKVTTNNYQLAALIQQFQGGKWQAMLQTAGAWDPAAGVGVGFRYNSTAPFSGVHDPKLDEIFQRAQSSTQDDVRAKAYSEAAKYISDHAYSPFGLAFAPTNVAALDVHGPGLTTKIPAILVNSGINWAEVWRANS